MPTPERKRLDSWGEIAQYLRRDITTVKRWEKEKGLPVHRLPGGKRQPVFAYQDEIDEWSSGGTIKRLSAELHDDTRGAEAAHASIASPKQLSRLRYVHLAMAVLLAGTIVVLLFLILAP